MCSSDLKDIPENSTVVGVPGRVVKRNNIKCEQIDLDQIHFPDPVSKDINDLREENRELRMKLEKLTESFEEFKEAKKNENT